MGTHEILSLSVVDKREDNLVSNYMDVLDMERSLEETKTLGKIKTVEVGEKMTDPYRTVTKKLVERSISSQEVSF